MTDCPPIYRLRLVLGTLGIPGRGTLLSVAQWVVLSASLFYYYYSLSLSLSLSLSIYGLRTIQLSHLVQVNYQCQPNQLRAAALSLIMAPFSPCSHTFAVRITVGCALSIDWPATITRARNPTNISTLNLCVTELLRHQVLVPAFRTGSVAISCCAWANFCIWNFISVWTLDNFLKPIHPLPINTTYYIYFHKVNFGGSLYVSLSPVDRIVGSCF